MNECMIKEIPWFKGYKVDSTWKVYSCYKWWFLKQSITKQWYKQVWLSIEWKLKTLRVHRLVMLTFRWKSPMCVNHIDWDKTNNKLDNLEYCSSSKNTQHAYDTGLIKKRKWLESHMYWLYWKEHNKSKSIIQYSKDWEFIKIWDSGMDIKRELNISSSNIAQCCMWKHVKTAWWYKWKYV